MVNFVKVLQFLLHLAAEVAGLRQQMVVIEPNNTLINFWIPKDHNANHKLRKGKKKPAVLLLHGFTADGLVTWYLQARALQAANYSVYVPDMLFFGKSTTESKERSPGFQAECYLRALDQLGVDECSVVGFSNGGFVAFKMAELRPSMVHSLVVSGSAIEMTVSLSKEILKNAGCSSLAELLLPENVDGLRRLFSVGSYTKLRFPACIYRDYLKVMFNNRKEREELLEVMPISDSDNNFPTLTQRILLLWGENDKLVTLEQAKNTMMQLGEKATLQSINKAGHLVHIERPCTYNRRIKEFLSQGNASKDASPKRIAREVHTPEGDMESQ